MQGRSHPWGATAPWKTNAVSSWSNGGVSSNRETSAARSGSNIGKGKPWSQSSSASKPPGAVPRATTTTAGSGSAKPTPAFETAGGAGASKTPSLKVTSNKRQSDVVVKTLVGSYAEEGNNHGRKYYQKTERIPGHENVEVFLYYWDSRDGAEFSGWWFGDKLGGTQVWAKASTHTSTPPKSGWCVPWDSTKPEEGVLYVEPTSGAGAATEASKAGNERLRKCTDAVTSAEIAANAAIAAAKKTGENKIVTEGVLKGAMDSLTKQQSALMELNKTLAQEVIYARKEGGTGQSTVAEITKFSTKVKGLHTSVSTELFKVKALHVKAANEQKKKDEEKKRKEQEEQEAREFRTVLNKVNADVRNLEKEVDNVAMSAALLIASPPEEGETLTKKLESVESGAEVGLKKLVHVRTDVSAKLTTARQYLGEAKIVAVKELVAVQAKLAEVQRKLNPFKNITKEFPVLAAAHKAAAEVEKQFGEVEPDLTKATSLYEAADSENMIEDELKAMEELVVPAVKKVSMAITQLGLKTKGAAAATLATIEELKKKGVDMRAKFEALNAKLRASRQILMVQKSLVAGHDKIVAVEDVIKQCQEAEMPFLKGIEVLPKEESDQAIGASEKASTEASRLVSQVLSYLQMNLASAKKIPKEKKESVVDQLTPLLTRAQAAEAKIIEFRKETADRKLNALLSEAVEAVAAAEKKIDALGDLGKTIAMEQLEEISIEDIKAAMEACKGPEKEAHVALSEAKSVFAAKQREAPKGVPAGDKMKKIQERLNIAQGQVSKQQQAMAAAGKFVRAKDVLSQEGDKMTEAEINVDKIEKMAPAEGAEMTPEAVRDMDEAMMNAQKVLTAVPGAIQQFMGTARPKLKEALKEMLDRKTKAKERLDKVKIGIKEPREKTLSQVFLEEAAAKVADLETAVEKTSETEEPYLKGVEVLPLKEAVELAAASENAAVAAQDVIYKTKQYIASKTAESKTFGAAEKKYISDGFSKLSEQIGEAATKLRAFERDTAIRKKAVQIQEAGERVSNVETEVQKVAAASEPFSKGDAEDMSEEAVAEPLKKFMEAETEASQKISDTKKFLAERQRASKENSEHMETLKKLQERMAEAQTEMIKAKKATAEHEGRFLAKRLLVEVNEQIGTLDREVKRATDKCAPLIEHGAEEYLVMTSVKVLATALSEHMKENEIGPEALYKEACSGKNHLSEDVFTKYVADLAEGVGKEEVNFPDARRKAVFKHMDADKDGNISLAEFEAIFTQCGVVKRQVAITDGPAVADSKVLCTAEYGDEVETSGEPKGDEANSKRIQCKLLKDGTKGWITLKGNTGAHYIEFGNPFNKFFTELEMAVNAADMHVNKVSNFLNQKMREGGPVHSGALKGAREEMAKHRTKVTEASGSLKSLRSKLNQGRTAFRAREKSELNAHIEEKERKAAAELTAPAVPKVEAVEAATKAVVAAGEPFASLATNEEVEAFATPVAVLESTDKLMAELNEKIAEARIVVKEQLEAAQKISPPTTVSQAAKNQLIKMTAQLDQSARAGRKIQGLVKSKCDGIVERVQEQASKALREETQKAGASVEKLYTDLANGEQNISEKILCAKLKALKDVVIPAEHAQLLCRSLESGGVSQRRFLGFVQLFYTVVKDIALTDAIKVGDCKTLRKAEKDEILEVLEGPVMDEESGLLRVRAKSIMDGTSGWVSVQGNQGTPFLVEVEKPFYTVRKEIPLTKDVKPQDDEVGTVRTLKEDEVLELVEGPRQEVLPDILRARVKATKDGAQGWLTLKDKTGATLAESNANLYVCKAMVAMTDSEDIKSSKVVRKLAPDEFFEVTGELKEDKDAGIKRAPGKALKDGKQGWITTKGNAGTVFVEPATKYYSVKAAMELQKRFASVGAETTRALEVGETFQVLEGPREEKQTPEVHIKVRAMSDKAVGWVEKKVDAVKNWKPVYRCVVPTPIQDTRGATEVTKTIRELAKAEQFEQLEGPVKEGKEVRMLGVARKDGVSGWVTVRDEEKRYMDC